MLLMSSRRLPRNATASEPSCRPAEHAVRAVAGIRRGPIERAASLFRAIGDEGRLRSLVQLLAGESCVSQLALTLGEQIPAVSRRLKQLSREGLVRRRRTDRHVYYSLADEHVTTLLEQAIAHARGE